MKRILIVSLVLLVIINGRSIAMGKNLPILRGVNMGNALEAPSEGQWGVVIRDEYFKLIRGAGFDHVRIPIKWNAYADYKPPYTINSYIFERVDHVVNEALKNGLYVIINIHHYEEIMREPEKHKERFLKLWEQISRHYQNYPESLYFELLNEPCSYLTSDLWNQYLKEAIKVIRKTNPIRKIIVGPTDWNSIYKLRELEIPDDPNIIVTFHYYNPFQFTHQGAEWVNPSPPVGVKWLGTVIEKFIISGDLDMAVEWSKTHNNVPLFLGEFGAYSKADLDSRTRWTSYVARSAEKKGISWCYWEFCAGFGIYDPIKEEWKLPLLRALIPQ
jgi:endoglucanase